MISNTHPGSAFRSVTVNPCSLTIEATTLSPRRVPELQSASVLAANDLVQASG